MLHVPTGLEHTPLFLSVKKQAASARSGHGLNGSQSPHPNAAKQEEVGIGLFPRSQDGAPPGRHHLSELLSNQKRLPLGDWPIPAFDLSRPNSQRGCPALLRFSEGGNLCGLHRAGFLSVCVTPDAQGRSQNRKRLRASSPTV